MFWRTIVRLGQTTQAGAFVATGVYFVNIKAVTSTANSLRSPRVIIGLKGLPEQCVALRKIFFENRSFRAVDHAKIYFLDNYYLTYYAM